MLQGAKNFNKKTFANSYSGQYTQSNAPLIIVNSCNKMAEERRKQTLFDKHDNDNYV